MSVQAGPNSTSGGFHDGSFSERYQGPMSVDRAPSEPTSTAAMAAKAIGFQRERAWLGLAASDTRQAE